MIRVVCYISYKEGRSCGHGICGGGGGLCWVLETVQECLGPVSYRVQLENGELWRRHLDHLREGPSRERETPDLERRDGPEAPDWQYASSMHESETAAEVVSSETERDSEVSDIDPTQATPVSGSESVSTDTEDPAPLRRYPSR